MNVLDMRTVIFNQMLTYAVCTTVLAFLWRRNRQRFAGTAYWLLDMVCQTAAFLLIALRGSVPDWVPMVVSNTLVIAGALAGYLGLARFVGEKIPQIHNYVLLAAFGAVHYYFMAVQPNLAARNFNLSLGLLIVCGQCVWLLLRRVAPGLRPMTRGVGLVFGGFCLVSLLRIIVILLNPPASNDFFRSGLYDTLLLMAYQILLILLTFGLALMVSRRLLMELQTQEAKFSAAFRSAPYALTLSRLPDGEIIEVNAGFVTLSGYAAAEAVGKTAFDLRLWARAEDRAAIVNAFAQDQRVQGREFQFRKKSGELLTGLLSAEIIRINDEPYMLTSVSDITDRRQAEEALRESQEEYRVLVEQQEDVICRWRPDTTLTFVNESYCRFFGKTRAELLNTPWLRFVPEASRAEVQRFYEALALHPQSYAYEHAAMNAQGELRWQSWIDSPIISDGTAWEFQSIGRDTTDRRQAEEQLRLALKEKTALLEEIHHRVKNNLQVIASMLYIQSEKSDHTEVRKVLADMRNRIFAMAAVHEQLYAAGYFADIDMVRYIDDLVTEISAACQVDRDRIAVRVHVAPLTLSLVQAVPCGLILQELLANAFQHGFPPGRNGAVAIDVQAQENRVTLRVRNSGAPFPADLDVHAATTMGLELVQTFTTQLRGTLALDRTDGTTFTITFPKK